MLSKRGVTRTDAIEKDTRNSASPRDPGAMSGLLTGVSFIAGVGGGVALADSPFPRPGSEPSEVSRYFTEISRSARLSAAGQLISAAALARFTASVARLAGRSGEGSQRLRTAAIAGGGLAVASLRGLGTAHPGSQWSVGQGRQERGQDGPEELRLRRPHPRSRLRVAHRRARAGRVAHGRAAPPRGDSGAGLGGLRLLSPLYFLKEQAGWLIPIGRFSGLVVSGISGMRLGRRKPPEMLFRDGS